VPVDSRRLLIVTPDFPPAPGGIQLLLGRLSERLAAEAVHVVTRGGREAPRREEDGARSIRRSALASPPALSLLAFNLLAIRRGLRVRPDAVLSGHVVAAPACAVLRAALRVPVVTYFHGDELAAYPALTRLAGRISARCIAVSRYTRDLAIRRGVPAERIAVVPPGVDAVRALPEGPGDAPARPTVITIARLADRYKGHDVMLEAIRRLVADVPDVEWVVVGDGPLRPELEARAAELGVEGNVRFAGRVDDGTRDRLLAGAHVFAMPSRLPPGGAGGEGFGIAYTEASARGLPCVGGRVAGALDAVEDGVTGILVDPTAPDELASALRTLLTDRELAARMGAAGRERARGYGWEVIAARVGDVIDEAIERAR
jgi:phosphatidyl-myo-inositol dimannoside synthase